MNLNLGREICNNREIAESREWLVTNGIGGYASGTLTGILTRCYHGLLVAALKPPVARSLLLTKLDEIILYNGQTYDLYTNRWADGTIEPQGYLNIESFSLDGTTPVWNFAFADGLLEKRIWMQQGENTTYIRYLFQKGSRPLTLSLKALVNYRDHHGRHNGRSLLSINSYQQQGLEITAFPDGITLYLFAIQDNQEQNFNWEINNIWYHGFDLAVEKYRGLDNTEDHLDAASGKITLEPGDAITIIASTENNPQLDSQVSIIEKKNRENELLNLWYSSNSLVTKSPNPQDNCWIEQLVLAADQFIVDRPLIDNPEGKTIIAGYPWFTDWGRDTMIALPGLTVSTGRYDIAKTILSTFANYVDQGMLPNMFPDGGTTPGYNTVDATLWYFEAIRAYYWATEDQEFLEALFPLLAEIIDWHIKGTRYKIKLDDDGLLYAGEARLQLTWMDAKIGDWVVTPRIGKPIEVNALWYNALVCMIYFAQVLGQSGKKYQKIAAQTKTHFAKFWYETGGYCYDVIDSPQGNDISFRPNQIFAISLPSMNLAQVLGTEYLLLERCQQKMIIDQVRQKLLTPFGLRSLEPDNPNYVGIYGGNQLQRDRSYHQGTSWSWLIGHFIQAHLRVYNNPELAYSFLLPMANHLQNGCIGTISEIFDGDLPFIPRGCFAQAWSVAEILRSWLVVQQKTSA